MNGALIGRSMELDALFACLKSAVAGEGAAALVEGEPGIGKSRLLQAFVEQVHLAGVLLLHGRGAELESNRPFEPMIQAMSGTGIFERAEPRRLDRELRMVDRLLDRIEELAAAGPVALVIDDLQWADPSTLVTLQGLLNRLHGLPIVVVVAARSRPRTAALEGLLEQLIELPCEQVRLYPLQPEEVSELVAADLSAEPALALIDQVGKAGGNPFYLIEFLRFLADEGAIEVRNGVAYFSPATLSENLSDTILRKLRFLDPGTRDLLNRASVLGSTFGAAELQALTGLAADGLIRPLREAVDAQLLHDGKDRFVFRHDLVREAFYQQIPEGLRGRLHLQAGQALSRIGSPSVRVATQFGLGALPGDRQASTILREAAAETASSSPSIAIGFLERAIELSTSGPDTDQLRVDLAPILLNAGRAGEARQILSEIMQREHAPELDLKLHFTMGRVLFVLGERGESIEQHDRASNLPGLSDSDRSVVHTESAIAKLFGEGDVVGALVQAERALQLALSASDDFARAMALCALSCTHKFKGELEAAVARSQEALELHRSTGTVQDRLIPTLRDPHVFNGMALLEVDRIQEGLKAFRTAIRLNEDSASGLGHVYHYWVGLALYCEGEWDDAAAELESGLSLADEWENRTGALAAHALLALIAFHRGTHEISAGHVEHCDRHFAESGPDFGMEWMMLAKALLANAGGNPALGCQILAGIWQVLGSMQLAFHYRTLGPDLVRLALLSGDVELAREICGELAAMAEREQVASVRGASLHCRGLVEADPQLLVQAVTAFRGSARPLPLAAAAEDAAQSLLAVSGTEEAKPYFNEALSAYRQAGADWDAARVAGTMRGAGIRRGTRGRRARPASGWESLTPTEHLIAGLVAEGLSNPAIGERLFISRRTVQTHVSHILEKLNLASRAGVAAYVALKLQGPGGR